MATIKPPGTPPKPPAIPPGSPKRAHVRTTCRIACELGLGRERFTALVHDLSPGGAGLQLDRALPEGAPVVLHLFPVLDDVEDEKTPPLPLSAEVIWCAESDTEGHYSAGVRWGKLSPHQTVWMAQFMRQE